MMLLVYEQKGGVVKRQGKGAALLSVKRQILQLCEIVSEKSENKVNRNYSVIMYRYEMIYGKVFVKHE